MPPYPEDVEERHLALEALRLADIGYWAFNGQGMTVAGSPVFAEWLGTTPSALVDSAAFLKLFRPEERDELALQLGDCTLGGVRFRTQAGPAANLRLLEISGTPWVPSAPALLGPRRHGVLLTLRDVTASTQHEQRLAELAYLDQSTGLGNVHRFEHELIRALRKPGRAPVAGAIVVRLANLARFASSAESLRTQHFLRIFADALRAALMAETSLRHSQGPAAGGPLLCHLDGGEFGILLRSSGSDDSFEATAQRILARIRLPLEVGALKVVPAVAMGLVLARDLNPADDSLVWSGRAAAFQAREDGPPVFLSKSAQAKSARRLMMEQELHGAAEREELEIVFQPRIELQTMQVVGAEALVRWRHPIYGSMSPAQFIPLAEECGAIHSLGAWILGAATRQVTPLRQVHGRHFRLSVNVSRVQLEEPNLVELVRAALDTAELPGNALELEITESGLMASPTAASVQLPALRNLGLLIAIDDFGTGQSSLAQLQDIAPQVVKIDQAFVKRLDEDSASKAVIEAVVTLCRSLGMRTVAEGVETPAQAEFLRDIGCDEGQGYLFSKPISLAEMLAMPSHLR